MRDYPSIARGLVDLGPMHITDKVDGSQIRAQLTKKGWRLGTRRQLLDPSDPILGPAQKLFDETMAEPLSRIARDRRWDLRKQPTVFMEYCGRSSLAGRHVSGEQMWFTVFDLNLGHGLLSQEELFDELDNRVVTPLYLGVHTWDEAFVRSVREGSLPGVLFEGVVGRSGRGGSLQLAKAKSQAWLDRVKELHGENEANS